MDERKLRIVFMGTPDFAVPCLKWLQTEQHNIVAVVTQPDRPKGRGRKLAFSPVKETALNYGLPIIQPEKIREQEFIDHLKTLQPDLIVVVAFGQILPTQILSLPPLGCINVHASLLPAYRGSAPIHWAIINGEKATGVTTMQLNEGMDTGDILLQAKTLISEEETTGELYERLQMLGAQLLGETVSLLAAGKAPRQPQDDATATYAPLLTRDTERIDWHQPANTIHNLVRGLNPWPGAYCLYKNRSLKLWQTKVVATGLCSENPGRIVRLTADGFVVETGCDLLEIIEIQPECKRRMNARDCACGYCIQPNEMLV